MSDPNQSPLLSDDDMTPGQRKLMGTLIIGLVCFTLGLGAGFFISNEPAQGQLERERQLSQQLKAQQQKIAELERSLTYNQTQKAGANNGKLDPKIKELHTQQGKRYSDAMRKARHQKAANLIDWFVVRWNSVLDDPMTGDRLDRRADLLSQLVGAMGENLDPADFANWQSEFFAQSWLAEIAYDLDGDEYPAPRKAKNPRDGFTQTSVCKIAMALNQTVTNAQVLVMPEMKCDRPEARMSVFLSSETIDGALTEFVKALRAQGYLVIDKTRQGVRRILLGPGRR